MFHFNLAPFLSDLLSSLWATPTLVAFIGLLATGVALMVRFQRDSDWLSESQIAHLQMQKTRQEREQTQTIASLQTALCAAISYRLKNVQWAIACLDMYGHATMPETAQSHASLKQEEPVGTLWQSSSASLQAQEHARIRQALVSLACKLSAELVRLQQEPTGSCWQSSWASSQEACESEVWLFLREKIHASEGLTVELPESLPLTPEQVRKAVNDACSQWIACIDCAASTRPQFLLPYLESSCRKYESSRTISRYTLRWIGDDEGVANQFGEALKHWASAQALLLILSSPYELKDQPLIERQLALFNQSLNRQASYDLKRMAEEGCRDSRILMTW